MTSFQAIDRFLVWDNFASVERKKMPDKCVVFGCNNRPNKEKSISLHPIPFHGTDDTEKRRRRKKWVDFVRLKRAHREPTKYSAVCSKHFLDENYLVMFSGLTKVDFQRRLRKDDIGICVFPTIHAPSISRESKPAESKRGEKKVRKYAFLCNEYVSIVLQCISS